MSMSLIAAVARNGVIGAQGSVPWLLRDDMKHFVEYTAGKVLLCGWKTYLTLPAHKLNTRERKLVVVNGRPSGNTVLDHGYIIEGIRPALKAAQTLAHDVPTGEICLIGGGTLYKELIDEVSVMCLTVVDATPPGDTFFPKVNIAAWDRDASTHHPADERNEHAFTVCHYWRHRA